MTAEWKMVPVEPTQAMLDAGHLQMPTELRIHTRITDGTSFVKPVSPVDATSPVGVYKAMLAASPSPPSGSDVGKHFCDLMEELQREGEINETVDPGLGQGCFRAVEALRQAAALIARLEAENAEKTKALEGIRNLLYCEAANGGDVREAYQLALSPKSQTNGETAQESET